MKKNRRLWDGQLQCLDFYICFHAAIFLDIEIESI